MKNADFIRHMTDEELANLFSIYDVDISHPAIRMAGIDEETYFTNLNFLKSEYDFRIVEQEVIQ